MRNSHKLDVLINTSEIGDHRKSQSLQTGSKGRVSRREERSSHKCFSEQHNESIRISKERYMGRWQWILALSCVWKNYQWSWKVVSCSIYTRLIGEKDTWIDWSPMSAVWNQIDTNYKSDNEFTLQYPLRWWNELPSGYYHPIRLQKRYRQLHFVLFYASAFLDDSPTFPVTLFRQRYFLEISAQVCAFSLLNSVADGETKNISSGIWRGNK